MILARPDIDPNEAGWYGVTALEYAISDGRIDLVQRLLQHPDIDPNLCYNQGSVLDCLARNRPRDEEILSLLLHHPAIDSNAGIEERYGEMHGQTALFHFAEEGLFNMAAQLLEHPLTDPNLPRQRDGKTPLQVAKEKGHDEVVQLLLSDPRINPDLVSEQDGASCS
ncbi:ankyrin repeat-containing domain protein [Xylariaceae sp. FL0255]|nr:ankyrin repeat-containing domain protein [Xylariaceae sp. FL0255]